MLFVVRVVCGPCRWHGVYLMCGQHGTVYVVCVESMFAWCVWFAHASRDRSVCFACDLCDVRGLHGWHGACGVRR